MSRHERERDGDGGSARAIAIHRIASSVDVRWLCRVSNANGDAETTEDLRVRVRRGLAEARRVAAEAEAALDAVDAPLFDAEDIPTPQDPLATIAGNVAPIAAADVPTLLLVATEPDNGTDDGNGKDDGTPDEPVSAMLGLPLPLPLLGSLWQRVQDAVSQPIRPPRFSLFE